MQDFSIYYTNTTPKMGWCSYKIKPRKERAKNGMAPLVLQIFIQNRKTVLDINISVQLSEWIDEKEEIRGKSAHIKDANLMIQHIKSIVHNILIDFRIQNKVLTREAFKDAFLNRNSREDFMGFFFKEIHDRYSTGIIEHSTYKHHLSVYKRMSGKFKSLPFSEISLSTLEEMLRYLNKYFIEHDKRVGESDHYHTATIWGHFKVLKTYMNIALNRGIKFEYPFPNFKISRGSGRIIYLNQHELKKIVNAWSNHYFKGTDHYSITIFLFACYTSMRISDIKRLTSDDILEDYIVIRPEKTKKSGKIVRIPLNNISREILKDRSGVIFDFLSEQKINQHLKTIAGVLGINKKLSMHVGRHTFATEFLRRGGHIHVLQKIMGHNDIKTTMVYTHLHDEHLYSQMGLMDD